MSFLVEKDISEDKKISVDTLKNNMAKQPRDCDYFYNMSCSDCCFVTIVENYWKVWRRICYRKERKWC